MCCAFCYHDFDHLVPLLGRLGIEQDGPYSYLPNSLKDFPHQEEVRRLFAEAGLRDARYIELTGGIVAVHVGSKQNESRVNGRGIA
ncbi:MAG: hypothetical protein D9V47_05345 [Clostridia bacterium]|nr:MAG: hypothetical protein D9V47_05345 [Clostridia bacterium]